MSTSAPAAHQASPPSLLTGLQSDILRPAGGTKRRPIPSPLQMSESLRSASDASSSTPRSPPPPQQYPYPYSPRATHSSSAVPAAAAPAATTNPLSVDRVRAPNPAKKVPTNPALDDFRSAINTDALRDEATRAAANIQPSASRNVSAPIFAAAPSVSPPVSPTMISSSKSSAISRADPHAIMPRNPSIDSTISTISSGTSSSHRANGANAYRVSQESSRPEDVATLIATAGSPEAAIQKLINDKNQAASHNAQLWRLVEKQRAMILGLNKDLEKSLKEKEKYRRKLKDHLVQSESAPSLAAPNQHVEDLVAREDSQSPAVAEESSNALAAATESLREMSMDSRKVSDTSDAASMGPGRSDTPQDGSNVPSSALPATPQSAHSGNAIHPGATETDVTTGVANLESKAPAPLVLPSARGQSPPLSPRLPDASESGSTIKPLHKSHQKNLSISSVGSPPLSAASFSSQNKSRKAPPAPLDLAPQKPPQETINVTNNIIDPSDSEYEEDPDSARAEQMIRGRRKTREDDDREREAIARQQEEEYRSRSKKDKKSKSKPPTEPPEVPTQSDVSRSVGVEPAAEEVVAKQYAKLPSYESSEELAATERQRAVAEASGALPKNNTAPSLLSPGLPMSPRPGDRPMNSPMPRAPNKMLNSIPMSPKSGMAGLPLSPRAPRQPIPMPPQTPLSFASPHLARAEMYQAPQAQPSSLASVMKSSPNDSPENERPSTSSDLHPMTPGEIYQGLVTEQYPDLLLPPNALPSIYVKTASSRMRPSRQSYIAPRTMDENPVFTLAVHERHGNKQLWRVEKTFAALAQLDDQIKGASAFREKLPDKALFNGHAPAKIDARRVAIDSYFGRMLDSVTDERPGKIFCQFLSTDAIGASDVGDYFGGATDARPDTPINKRPHREGYLTKRGKNFGGWKARYFILDGPQLKYYDNRGGAQLGSIKLQNAQIGKQSNNGQNPQEDVDNQFRHAFLVLEPKKKDSSSLVRHVLCAESDEERDSWVEALLQYVDYREDSEEVPGKAMHAVTKAEMVPPRSPRLQKSLNDIRPASRGREAEQLKPEPMRTVGYDDTVAGDAPTMGPSSISRKVDTPSPPHDANFGPAVEQPPPTHPTISGPTNLHVISNAGDWGMKLAPTPNSTAKDKKRSIFSGFRGRSSSDLDKVNSPGLAPQDHFATGSPRAVFGVPLAEAVEFARPADVATELPAVVYRCIEYLLAKNAIAEEGIFRLSGSNTVIKGLKDRFNTEGDVNLTADGKYYDIHAVASLLKLYLRELPSSILTRELHLEFLQCLEMHGKDKVAALNFLVNRLPRVNWALLEALSSFLLSIVNNSEVNKMNVRNVGIVFAPTLNVPAPLISCFVEDQSEIFGAPIPEEESPISAHDHSSTSEPMDLRSPRKQMFSDLPTPAYNQTNFQSLSSLNNDETGMIPMHPTYASYSMAPQGDGGFGSLNDALRSPTVYNTAASGVPSSRTEKSKRRESSMLGFSLTSSGIQKKSSMTQLREEEGGSF